MNPAKSERCVADGCLPADKLGRAMSNHSCIAQSCAILHAMSPPTTKQQPAASADRRELANRVRAAMAYAGLSRADIAEHCGSLSEAKIRRTLEAERDTSALELMELASCCGVPLSWFERGEWTANADAHQPLLVFGQGSLDERLRIVEHYLALLLSEAKRQSDERPLPLPDGYEHGARARRVAGQGR